MKTIDINCFVCGKIYPKSECEYKRSLVLNTPNCCSRICANRLPYRNRMKKQGICTKCGSPSSKDRDRNKLCSKCSMARRIERMEIGFFDWNNLRMCDIRSLSKREDYIYVVHQRIRDHSRSVYLHSNKPKCCANCGYSLSFHVCHIKAVKSFDKEEILGIVNHIDNLVALCRNCHWEFDNGILKL